MRIAVLASPTGWHVRDLKRAAADRHEVVTASFGALSSHIDRRPRVAAGAVRLDECDAVLVRSMPPGTLEQVVFRMDALARLESAGVRVINPAKAIEAAVDKHLATCRLASAGLRVPHTAACQSADEGMRAFEELGGDVVVKPLFGGEGRGVARLQEPALARREFSLIEQAGGVLYLQEFVPHEGFDLRLLVVGTRVLGMRRVNREDWRTNISRGAAAEPLPVTTELAEIALRAASAVGAAIAGVDLLPARDGRLLAIEVNAVPGWRALAGCTGVDVAQLVLEAAATRG